MDDVSYISHRSVPLQVGGTGSPASQHPFDKASY